MRTVVATASRSDKEIVVVISKTAREDENTSLADRFAECKLGTHLRSSRRDCLVSANKRWDSALSSEAALRLVAGLTNVWCSRNTDVVSFQDHGTPSTGSLAA